MRFAPIATLLLFGIAGSSFAQEPELSVVPVQDSQPPPAVSEVAWFTDSVTAVLPYCAAQSVSQKGTIDRKRFASCLAITGGSPVALADNAPVTPKLAVRCVDNGSGVPDRYQAVVILTEGVEVTKTIQDPDDCKAIQESLRGHS